jgi:hypothetical protein
VCVNVSVCFEGYDIYTPPTLHCTALHSPSELIAHVVATFDPDRDGSTVYYGIPDASQVCPKLKKICEEKNHSNYSFHYEFGSRSWVLRKFYSAHERM